MKHLLIAILTVITVTCNGQYLFASNNSYTNPRAETIEVLPTVSIIATGYTINKALTYSKAFDNMTISEKNQTSLAIYATTAITAVATHYIIKHIRSNKHKRKNRIFVKRF
jgi:hypothetical protein